MILTVDIGNSNIVIGCVEHHKVQFVERMHSDRSKTDLEYVIGCKMVLDLHQIAIDTLDGAIISSVVPQLTDLLSRAIEKLTGIVPMVVGPGMKTGIKHLPNGVGADLVVGAVAVLHDYSAPAIIIDMGTATTITVLDKDGNFIGGVIYPGVASALTSLVASTALLPDITLKAPPRVINMNTIDCMQSGVVYSNAGAIDAFIERMTEELGYPAAAIACGGLAPLIVPQCRHEIIIDDELLLKGLDILFEKNKKKSD